MQKQKQVTKQKQDERQKEIQYFIYQDLENILCNLGEFEQTMETLEESEDKSYLPIAYNRLILQTNLSNAIHYEQYTQDKGQQRKFVEDCNQNVKAIFDEVLKARVIQNTDSKVQKIIEQYVNKNLNAASLEQLPLEKVDQQVQFNQKTVEKLLQGTMTVDNKLQQLKNQDYTPPTAEQIIQKINQRKKYCDEQLKINFQIQEKNQSNEKGDSNTKNDIQNSPKKEEYKNEEFMNQTNQDSVNNQQENGIVEEKEVKSQNLNGQAQQITQKELDNKENLGYKSTQDEKKFNPLQRNVSSAGDQGGDPIVEDDGKGEPPTTKVQNQEVNE